MFFVHMLIFSFFLDYLFIEFGLYVILDLLRKIKYVQMYLNLLWNPIKQFYFSSFQQKNSLPFVK